MAPGRQRRDRPEFDREDLLSALALARTRLIEAQRSMRPRSGLSRSAEAVISEIDELAFVLTGSREYFYSKAHGTPARSGHHGSG